jgi:hypothetical protein
LIEDIGLFVSRAAGRVGRQRGCPDGAPPSAPVTCIEDLRKLAERRVPRMFYDYADSGSYTEGT